MKIIRVDNYDRDDWNGNERVVASELMTDEMARVILAVYENNPNRPPQDWYRIVPDDHKLKEWRP